MSKLELERGFYEAAQQEISSGATDVGIWAKALVLTDGDQERARLKYVQLRVEYWQDQAPTPTTESAPQGPDSRTAAPAGDAILFKATRSPFAFTGTQSDLAFDGFRRTLKAKQSDAILADVLLTDRVLIVAPSSKDLSSRLGLFAMFGGGAVGALGLSVIQAAGDLWAARSGSGVKVKSSEESAEVLRKCLVWKKPDLRLSVSEERVMWDLMGGEWVTTASLVGRCTYDGAEVDIGVDLPYEGKFSNLPLRVKPTPLLPLLRAFGFDPASVTRK